MQIRNTILSQSDLKILQEVILQYGRVITFTQLASLFEATYKRAAIRQKVALLAKKGWLVRLKRGEYLVITDISTLGSIDLSENVIAQFLNKDSYISFENALQYHGLFDQMLTTVGSVTTMYARNYAVQKTNYTFSHMKKALYFGYTEETIGSYKVKIAEQEKALLDMLYFKTSAYIVSIVLEKLREYKHRLDFEKLQRYAQKFGTGMVRIVGFLLDQIEVDTNVLATSVKQEKNSYNKLTKESTKFDAKWRLYYDPYLIT